MTNKQEYRENGYQYKDALSSIFKELRYRMRLSLARYYRQNGYQDTYDNEYLALHASALDSAVFALYRNFNAVQDRLASYISLGKMRPVQRVAGKSKMAICHYLAMGLVSREFDRVERLGFALDKLTAK